MVSFVPVLIYCYLFKADDDFYVRTFQNCTVELFTHKKKQWKCNMFNLDSCQLYNN